MLMSQFTITGFDACAHMSEETVGADKSAPMAIVMAIGVSAIAGFAYILAITFSIQVSTTLLASFHCCLQFCLSLSTHLPLSVQNPQPTHFIVGMMTVKTGSYTQSSPGLYTPALRADVSFTHA